MEATARTTPAVDTPEELEAQAHETIAEGHAMLARAARLRTAPAAEVWLTLDAAGERVSKTARAIRDAGRRGELRIDHAGRSPRVSRAALDEWIASRPGRAIATTPSDDADNERAFAVAARRAGGSR